jgi:hypothetical protein
LNARNHGSTQITNYDPDDSMGLARWLVPVCPLISGLSDQDGEFVLGRVSEIARKAGAPIAGEKCRPNLYILISANPAELLRGMERRNRVFTFADAPSSLVDEFIASPRPVRADRMKLNARIERQKPRLGNRWDLRCVLHFEENKRRPLTIVVCEVNGLWLQIREYGLDGCAEFSGLRRRVPGLDRNAHFDKKSHRSSPGEWWIVAVSDRASHFSP